MWLVVRFCYTQFLKIHYFLLRHHQRLLFGSLLIGLTTASAHWQTIRHPALMEHFHENLRSFPVEISLGAFALFAIGTVISYGFYRHYLRAKENRSRIAIRQRYLDYIVLCLMVSVVNSARDHLHCTNKEGLGLRQFEGYRREINVAVGRFRTSARKLLHEPPLTLNSSNSFLERYFHLDDERFGEEILALKRDSRSLMSPLTIKGLLEL
uniref:Uncharacterized protein n=1 Tax=Anopheles farauti TaxID=69004 RepID=A0A182QF87_9DIPT